MTPKRISATIKKMANGNAYGIKNSIFKTPSEKYS
jgi:hypothetical protein